MTSFLAWMLGSKIGRYVSIVILIIALAGVSILLAVRRGVEQERAKQLSQSLTNALKRIQANDEVVNMDANDRRNALREWMR